MCPPAGDPASPTAVRSAAAAGLAGGGAAALPALRAALSAPDAPVRASAAISLGILGESALPVVLDALQDPASETGALLALEQLPAWKVTTQIRDYASGQIGAALRYDQAGQALADENDERIGLLADLLRAQARRAGLRALRALGTLGRRDIVAVALDNLQSGQASQVANALETLEATLDPATIRPLLALWEPALAAIHPSMPVAAVLDSLRAEPEPWLRACVQFVSDSFTQEKSMEGLTTLSLMERVLLLRRVPLLAGLAPADLQPIAVIAHEHHFADGEVVFEQNEPGDEMYMIVSGEVRVIASRPGDADLEIARRAAGEVVGEMAIIDDEPRSASGIACGKVHALALDRKSFESLLRERPEVSLAVMRVLCKRLRQSMK